MPTSGIVPAAHCGGPNGNVPLIAAAFERFCTHKVVIGCRVSATASVYDGTLLLQIQALRTDIRNADGQAVGIVDSRRAHSGKLATGRPDLIHGVRLARRLNAVLCYRDLTRLFRPDAFDTQTNPYAPYTVADFERLWTLVGDDAPLCVFDAPETTVRELHVLKTKHGMERARREGRLPGRRTGVSDRIFQLVVNDHYVGLSPRQICERYGVPRTTVRRLIASLDL